jgi:hypothetical protein
VKASEDSARQVLGGLNLIASRGVEVEEILPAGALDPDCIHLPGVYVQRMIVGSPYDKKIEFTTVRERETA